MVCFTNSVRSRIQNEPVLGWTTAIKMTVLHRSDGERLTEDTGRKFKRNGMSTAVLDVDLEVTLTSLSVLFLAACSKASYIALLICKLGPPRTCFEASLPFPVGSREKQRWGGVVRSGNGGIVVGWLLCLELVLAPDVVQGSTGLEDQ